MDMTSNWAGSGSHASCRHRRHSPHDMKVTRRQYPVGQGCFHAGHICRTDETGQEAKFRYVYDCGSTNQNVLRGMVDSYRMQASRVEALFVTHLDDDHVNGIDRLLGSIQIDTVYIPYVDDVVPVLELVEADLAGTLSASLVEARVEPWSWLGRRGVSRVVRVRASADDGPPRPETGDSNQDAQDSFAPDRAEIPLTSDQDIGAEIRDGVRVRDVNSGDRLRFFASGRRHSWTLVPHVDPAPAVRLQKFENELRSVLSLPPGQPITALGLAAALRSTSERKRLRDCYENILPGGSSRCHNRVSMSLYSGPPQGGLESSWNYCIVGLPGAWPHRWFRAGRTPWHQGEARAVGWLGTGDAELRMAKALKAWQDRYLQFGEQVGTLLLPHHGATGNFHPDLLQFPNLALCVASAGKPSPYRHPGQSVVDEILNRGIAFRHVSQQAQSGVQEEISSR